jgi:hypothetical protein
MKTVLIGSNPSNQSPDCSPFHMSTRSRTVVDAWFKGIDTEIIYMNICDLKMPGNKPLTRKQITESIPDLKNKLLEYPYAKVVTVGKAATTALTLLRVPHFEMPHPSGANRLLNDPKYVEEKIKKLKFYLELPETYLFPLNF